MLEIKVVKWLKTGPKLMPKWLQIQPKTGRKSRSKNCSKIERQKGATRRKACEQRSEPNRHGGDNRGGLVTLLLLCYYSVTKFTPNWASTRPDPQGVGGLELERVHSNTYHTNNMS